MDTIKKILVLTAAVAVLPVCAMAQHFGVGINNPTATLQVHSYTQIEDFPFPWVPNPTGGRNEGDTINRDDPPSFEHYLTTFHMTNSNTGTDTSDGLLVRQHDLDVAIVQQEMGTLWVKNHYAQLELTSYGFGVGHAQGGFKFNVEGQSRFTQGVTMLSWLNVTGGVTAGSLRVSDGLYCDANGNLEVKHLKVTMNVWPDYVFGGEHALMPLGELESYINSNNHLPGVPTAEEVEKDGADVGEMNRVLMEKVEELTLYIIDLQKQIDELKFNKEKN